jgi:predicted ester cyclase
MPLSSDEQIARANRWFHDGISSNDFDTAAKVAYEVFTEDFVDGDSPGGPQTREEFLNRIVRSVFRVFTEIDARVEFSMAADNVVASRMRFKAIHSADYMGFAATNAPIEFTESGFAFFRGDQIAKTSGDYDRYGMFLQLQAAAVPS